MMDRPPAVYPLDRSWDLQDAIALACTLEAASPKAGNVHATASFGNMHFGHYAAAAAVLARVLSRPPSPSVGRCIWDAVEELSQRVGVNTSLGTIMLLAPITVAWSAARGHDVARLRHEVDNSLRRMGASDAEDVYRAIRLAAPGGLGQSATHDVHGPPPHDLIAAMAQAAPRDAVARQFTIGLADIFDVWLPQLDESARIAEDVQTAVCWLQVRMLAAEPDGLIHRKCGAAAAREVQGLAQQVLAAWLASTPAPPRSVRDILACPRFLQLDASLRDSKNRRNPGTTADMITATLLVRLLVGP
ncbi:MAG: hypothetical protein D6753_04100 [Planctomycetota bacterium]|nr:MAG: hypothetical protein D6753_04100 [Planctomycetota bacterium]